MKDAIKSFQELKKLLPNLGGGAGVPKTAKDVSKQTENRSSGPLVPPPSVPLATAAPTIGVPEPLVQRTNQRDLWSERFNPNSAAFRLPLHGGSQRRSALNDSQVIIGLDFGTRYSKIFYRFYGDQHPKVVECNQGSGPNLWPSHVFIHPESGTVHAAAVEGSIELAYLKMRLRNPELWEFAPHPRIAGYLGHDSEQALAAYYLAWIIRQTKEFVRRREARRLGGYEPQWQVNLSIPAQYSDDGLTERFRVVGSVALAWSLNPTPMPAEPVMVLVNRFTDTASSAGHGQVEVFAEIVAALHNFIHRRDTRDGIHGFLDIGAGTLDGCVFRLRRAESPSVTVLSAAVAPLGTVAVSKYALRALYENMGSTIETAIVASAGPERVELPLGAAERKVTAFVGGLMTAARDNSPNRTLKQPSAVYESDPTRIGRDDSFALRCSGGGARSLWYKRVIEMTYERRKHFNLGIMPYSVTRIGEVMEAAAGGTVPLERFVIAHGLSSPAEELEGVSVRLPKEVEAPTRMANRPVGAADYLSTKELT